MDEADALLCEWEPHDELLIFAGPKAFYNSEAISRRMFREESKWEFLFADPNSQLFLHHAHPNPDFRVPMISFIEPIKIIETAERKSRAVAIISNAGTAWSTQCISIRNQFATHPMVDLYGSRTNWSRYMQQNNSVEELPPNYKREIAWPWNSLDKLETMAHYHAAICLENVTEPYYFTEKFYAGAQTGCIPIYHAHPTVSNTVLKNAMWVDPAAFSFDVDKTMAFAMSESREIYANNNFKWLTSTEAIRAGLCEVFRNLGRILTRNIGEY